MLSSHSMPKSKLKSMNNEHWNHMIMYRNFDSQLGFPYFEFKIWIIRLGLSFQKKFLYLNSQPTDFL